MQGTELTGMNLHNRAISLFVYPCEEYISENLFYLF